MSRFNKPSIDRNPVDESKAAQLPSKKPVAETPVAEPGKSPTQK